MFRIISILILMSVVIASQGIAQHKTDSNPTTVNAKFGKGINVLAGDSSFSLKLGFRMQFLTSYNYQFEDDNVLGGKTDALLRRSRIKMEGFMYKPELRYKVEFGLTNRDMESNQKGPDIDNPGLILDAVLKYRFAKNFDLWAGQTKLPGNRQRIVSSANLQLVDRSLVNSRFTTDRDIGFWLHHKAGKKVPVYSAIAVTTGEGKNRKTGKKGLSYSARAEIMPLGDFTGGKKGAYVESDLKREKTPKLAIAVAYNYNDGATRTNGQTGVYFFNDEHKDIQTIFADMIFKYRGFSVMGEFAWKDTENPLSLEEGAEDNVVYVFKGNGINGQVSYLFKSNYEITARYTQLNPHADIQDYTSQRNDMTLGFSKYIVGHKLKVQADVTYSRQNDDGTMIGRFQIEAHF